MQPLPASRVGIVVRTKDRPFFLRRALQDIVSQRFNDWHVVIANDQGGRAEVDAIVEALGDRINGRVTVVDVPAPGGRCAAANTALRELRAEYVVLHDDDDWWSADFLELTVAWLDDHSSDAAVGVPTEIVYERAESEGFVEIGRAPFWADMTSITLLETMQVNHVVPISLLYRASLHPEVGFYDETLDAVEDWEFYLRVLMHHSMGFIPGKARAFWSQRPSALGADGNSMFALGDVHQRSDAIVRDRALAAYTRSFGPGLPLYLSWLVQTSVDNALRDQRSQQVSQRISSRIRRRLTRQRRAN